MNPLAIRLIVNCSAIFHGVYGKFPFAKPRLEIVLENDRLLITEYLFRVEMRVFDFWFRIGTRRVGGMQVGQRHQHRNANCDESSAHDPMFRGRIIHIKH